MYMTRISLGEKQGLYSIRNNYLNLHEICTSKIRLQLQTARPELLCKRMPLGCLYRELVACMLAALSVLEFVGCWTLD